MTSLEGYTFVGSSDVQSCREGVKQLLSQPNCSESFEFCPEKVDIPRDVSFFVKSEFQHVFVLQLVNEDDVDEYEDEGSEAVQSNLSDPEDDEDDENKADDDECAKNEGKDKLNDGLFTSYTYTSEDGFEVYKLNRTKYIETTDKYCNYSLSQLIDDDFRDRNVPFLCFLLVYIETLVCQFHFSNFANFSML